MSNKKGGMELGYGWAILIVLCIILIFVGFVKLTWGFWVGIYGTLSNVAGGDLFGSLM